MAFQIGTIEPGGAFTPLSRRDGSLRLYQTGKKAARVARVAAKILSKKVQPRAIKDDDWRQREADRFASGEYEKIAAWADWQCCVRGRNTTALAAIEQAHPDHFVHLSVAKKSMIAFTPDEAYGAQNRKLRLSPGVYLQRYCGDLFDQRTVTGLARAFGAKHDLVEVLFATTAKQIRSVYCNGPPSCMAGEAQFNYTRPHHPVEAYAAGDLAVAYLDGGERGCDCCVPDDCDCDHVCGECHDGDCSGGVGDGSVTARALVWPAKKIYCRAYGDSWRLEQALARLGYQSAYATGRETDWLGARLAKIPVPAETRSRHCGNRDGWVLPYFDFGFSLKHDGDHFVVAADGYIAGGTSGFGVDQSTACCKCPARDHTANLFSCGDGAICNACIERLGYRCSELNGVWYPADVIVEMHDGAFWTAEQFRAAGFTCSYDGKRYHRRAAVVLHDGSRVATHNVPAAALHCGRCAQWIAKDGCVERAKACPSPLCPLPETIKAWRAQP